MLSSIDRYTKSGWFQKRAAGKKAMDMIDYLLRAAPENGEVYLLRSQIYEELGEKEKAAADKAKAFEIQPQLRSVTEG